MLHGFVRMDQIFSQEIADAALDILWHDLPCDRSDPSTWTEPVIRLGMYSQPPFLESVNSTRLHSVFDQLIGEGKWLPLRGLGTFPVRFPGDKQPNDTGKHVDAGFPGDEPGNYFEWRVNLKSKGRALLLLVLYSDVSQNDAPTIIYKGSHLVVAKILSQENDRGLSFLELANQLANMPEREQIVATGKAGTVYLCHPFLVHSAQAHSGHRPRFMAQPALLLKNELTIENSTIGYSPLESAIRLALNKPDDH